MPRKTHNNGNMEGNGTAAAPAPKRPKATRKRAPRKSAKKPAIPAGLNDEAIRLRAYFISESRVRLSLPGDPASDWIEARRQLLAELDGETAS